jgi:allophanate hydrolase
VTTDPDPDPVALAVAGAHLSGQPLNHQLTDRGARLVATTTTAPVYRFYALDTTPPKPGLVRVTDGDAAGAGIEVEVWELTAAAFGTFVDAVPAPLCIGRVRLTDGSAVAGFLCEPLAVDGAVEITHHGSWRAYLACR